IDDYYEFLEVSSTASTSEIQRAYRKKALRYHPDKNPDNPYAKSKFEQLSKILDILSESGSREKYDRSLRARKEKAMRDAQLDAKRRKLREELEAKEQRAKEEKEKKIMEDLIRMRDAEKTRCSNLFLLEKENQNLRNRLNSELSDIENRVGPNYEILFNVKIQWDHRLEVTSNALFNIFSKFGEISVIMIPNFSKAEIEIKSKQVALQVVNEKFDNLIIKGLQVVVRPRPESSPFGPRHGQSLENFENEVLSKLRLAQQYRNMGQPPPPLIC
ncbi:dnaJ homolog subfamily C member 17-like, partial [Panonychus citri]|uniref:dnaJ homolog subfamily C member 17-like n=1 Tax=Panonychus citri TaxID=50023 RepID=UPI0023081F64